MTVIRALRAPSLHQSFLSWHREYSGSHDRLSGRRVTSVLYGGGGNSTMYVLNAATGAVLRSYSVGETRTLS